MTDVSPPPARDRVLTVLLVGAAIALGLAVVVLIRTSIDLSPSVEAGAANRRALVPLWITSAVAWLALGGCWWRLARVPSPGRPTVRAAIIVATVALVARGAVVFLHTPALSDDINRYVFDGRNTVAGVNPYSVVPETRASESASVARWTGEAAVAERVNNPELPTIYLPTSQYVFAIAGWLVPDAATDPVAMGRVFRALFALLDVVVVALLMLHLARTGRSVWWAALYAWHPLPVTEIAGAGHQDVIGIVLLVAALVLATGRPPREIASIALLAVASLVKPVAVPVAAFVLRRRPVRAWGRALIVGLVLVTLLAAPLLASEIARENLAATATRFSLKWAHFGSVYEPLLAAIEVVRPAWSNDHQEQLARKICLAVLAIAGLMIWWRGRDPWSMATGLLLAMVLVSPTAHPWYLLWALVLVPVSRHRAAWIASLTLPWGYVVLTDTIEWTVPIGVMFAAYVPVYAAILIPGAITRRLSRRNGAGESGQMPYHDRP